MGEETKTRELVLLVLRYLRRYFLKILLTLGLENADSYGSFLLLFLEGKIKIRIPFFHLLLVSWVLLCSLLVKNIFTVY